MPRLDYSAFEQAVYPYCGDISRIGDYIKRKVGLLNFMTMEFFDEYILLAAGLSDDDVSRLLEGGARNSGGVSEVMLSKYRNRKASPQNIKKAYLQKEAIHRTQKHFEKYLLPTITRGGEYGILYDVWRLILQDESIPKVYKEDFEYFYSIEPLSAFLANVFVFAMTRSISVNVEAIEKHEKGRPSIHPDTAKAIRDVQIRGDLSSLTEMAKKIIQLLDDAQLDSDIRDDIRWNAAILWRETNSFIDAGLLKGADHDAYERLSDLSYTYDYYDVLYENRTDLFRRIDRLDDKYFGSDS